MKIAYYVRNEALKGDVRISGLLSVLERGGCFVYHLQASGFLEPGTDIILSFGGDGTFLSAARIAAASDIPILGVNMGHLGFLSSHTPSDVAGLLLSGEFQTEAREMLAVSTEGKGSLNISASALNEMTVHRAGAAMLGVDVTMGDTLLPTYWADGLMVSTASGSTAYNLSAGGPICTPDTGVLLITPIAPHNLNVRPLIVPDTTILTISMHTRETVAALSVDNLNYTIPSSTTVRVSLAPQRLRIVRMGKSEFISALRSRLLWGADVRNTTESY